MVPLTFYNNNDRIEKCNKLYLLCIYKRNWVYLMKEKIKYEDRAC